MGLLAFGMTTTPTPESKPCPTRLPCARKPDETAVRAKAREAIRTGKMPSRRRDRTWGGPGVGVICTVCGEAVRKDQLEMQVEFSHDGSTPRLASYHIHLHCFAAWELERHEDGGPHS